MAFTKFLSSAIQDHPLTLFGNGNQTRDFTFIDDIINANISTMNTSSNGEIINVGGGHVISVNNVLKIIEKITKKKLKISYLEKQKGDVKHTQANISKAKKILNFKPRTKIESGLEKEFNYLIQNFNLYK